MARTKLTKERKDIILHEISEGNTKENAAKVAGISEATLYNWIAKGRTEEPPAGLEDMTKKELVALAKKHQVKGYHKMNKSQLISRVEEAATIHRALVEEMEFAEARGISEHVKTIKKASKEDWKASAWFLERKDPANWAKKDRLHVENNHSGSIQTEHTEKMLIEIRNMLEQDPELQRLYMKVWERQKVYGE